MENREELLFIYNPYAGKAQIRNKLMDIIDTFVKAGYNVTAYPTQKQGDAIETTKIYAGRYHMIVCSGGDGTLDEVVTGMMQSNKRIPIGYIPAGSTNDFANSLHIPRGMLKATDIITQGNKFKCDVGAFNDDFFVYIAAFGLFTDVSYETRQPMKNVLGHMAYIMEGMKRLSTIRSYRLKVTYDEHVIEDEFLFGMITNSISVGGFKRITGKWVELDDGLFEVTLIKLPTNVMELNEIMGALIMKDIDTEYMYCFKTGRLQIKSEAEIPWTLDGEYGGSYSEILIENENQAIEIMVPIDR